MTETVYNELLDEAEYFKENNEPEKAEVVYLNILEVFPEDSAVHFLLGDLYYAQRAYKRAVEHYLKVVHNVQNDDRDLAYAMLGICYMNLAETVEEIGHTEYEEKAINCYKEAIKINPSMADDKLLFDLGLAYVYTQQWDSAIDAFEKAVEQNNTLAQAYSYLGSLYAEKGDKAQAVIYFLAAIENDQNNSYYYQLLGQVYGTLKQYDKAIEVYKQSVTLNDTMSDAFSGLADAYNHKGMLEQAIEYAHRALDINVEDAYAFRTLGESYALKHETEKAEKYFEFAQGIESLSELEDGIETESQVPENLRRTRYDRVI